MGLSANFFLLFVAVVDSEEGGDDAKEDNNDDDAAAAAGAAGGADVGEGESGEKSPVKKGKEKKTKGKAISSWQYRP